MQLLVDAHYLLHRCMHVPALSGLHTHDGRRTGAIFGFLRALRSTLVKFNITECIVVFDSGISSRRRALDPTYKAHRKKPQEEMTEEDVNYRLSFHEQRTLLRYVLLKLGCRVVTVPNTEADDIIFTLARRTISNKVVMSDDKDYFQMVAPATLLYRPMHDEVINCENFEEHFGLPQEKFLLARALMGDPSDGIQGIKGIGQKTAQKLLAPLEEVSVDSLLSACEGKKSAVCKTLLASRERLERNLALLDLELEVLSETQQRFLSEQFATAIVVPSLTRALEFFHRFEMHSFMGDDELKTEDGKQRAHIAWADPFMRLVNYPRVL